MVMISFGQYLVLWCLWFPLTAGAAKSKRSMQDLEYQVFPRRTRSEAVVLEWGHSAIITALDGVVAWFGPQEEQAALLEVECAPILASPVNGVPRDYEPSDDDYDDDKRHNVPIKALGNAEEVHGNIVVMTNTGGLLSGLDMAKIAKLSGAAALLVVNVNQERPDDVYRLALRGYEDQAEADEIDIPVVMISLSSANVLTKATVTPDIKPEDAVNNGMPDRVRLYASGDRPFFEDVEHVDPTLYLIHNMLTEKEADDLREKAEPKMKLVESDDLLQLTHQASNYHKVKRTMIWQGIIKGPAKKAMDERIEQVTGFPSEHLSDFVIDKLEPGSYWKPHYDTHPYLEALASINIFLTDVKDTSDVAGSIAYPSATKPIRIAPVKGLAVVHHNRDANNELDLTTVHALLPPNEPLYVARRYMFKDPLPNSRRIALPIMALSFGGTLLGPIILLHDKLIEKYGMEQGAEYFDKACIFIPVLVILLILQLVGMLTHSYMKSTSATAEAATATTKKSSKATKTQSKKKNKSE